MRSIVCLAAVVLPIAACQTVELTIPDGGVGCPALDASTTVPDLAVAPPKCAAAKGLQGDNLLCVDFKDVQMPSSLTGWNFNCMQVFDSWTTTGGKLQVNNFSTFMSTCSFTLPALSAADYQKYSSFTLSVVQRVHIDDMSGQTAQVMLGADAPATRLITQWTGKGARQTSTLTITKADLPNGGTGAYQPLFKITSTTTAGGSFQGWLIESIAVNGNL